MKKLFILIAVIAAAFSVTTASAAPIEHPNGDGSGSPDATRLRFCQIAYEFLDKKLGTPLTAEHNIFTDTSDEYVCTLASLGIIEGRGGGIFDPDGLITREEAAKILCTMMDVAEIPDNVIVDEQFKDIDNVSDWAKEYVNKVGRNEIMSGNGNGYDLNGNYPAVTYPRNTFHLYDSEFAPKSNYTEWQTRMTMYNLSCKMPEITGDETVTEIGDIKVLQNENYLWAEKAGELIYSTAYSGGNYYTVITEGSRPLLGYGRGVYDLDTGSRLFKLEHDIYGMNRVFVTSKGYFRLDRAGLVGEDYFFAYDYRGKLIMSVHRSQYRSYGYSWDALKDENGNAHYVVPDDGKKLLTEIDSMTPVVSGKNTISSSKIDKYFYCTEDINGETFNQLYDFSGNEIYSGTSDVSVLTEDLYAVLSADGKNSAVYSFADNTELFKIKGSRVDKIEKNYFSIQSPDYNVNFYSFDGSVINEDARWVSVWKDADMIEVTKGDEEYTSYIYDSETLELKAVVDGNLWQSGAGYYISKLSDTHFRILDKDWNEFMEFESNYKQVADYIILYPHDDEESGIQIYSDPELELLWNIDEAVYKHTVRPITSSPYLIPNITDDYIMTEKDGEIHLNNMKSKKSLSLPAPDNEDGYILKESDGIAAVWDGRNVALYDSELNALYSGTHSSDEVFRWNGDYIQHAENIYKEIYIADLYGNETGIVADHILFHTVNGKQLLITWDDHDSESKVYDYYTLEYLFSIKGQAWNNRSDKFIQAGKGADTLYFDENGNRIEKPEE